ncbi:indole-3-acetic acid-amido synthetase GH3.2-like [Silene latifolia]|uniref:indole-3-acetic acid-amido synthetase GH3.2-like n=1 Tax=Silene latifolia TaxID=37657 RepID=UPI003D77A141
MASKKEPYVEGGSVSEDADHGYEASVKFLEEITSNCDEVQEKVLAEILTQNAETEYLKRQGMSHGNVDRLTFKTNMPIIAYEDIKPDILRLCNEDPSPILCAKPITELWMR